MSRGCARVRERKKHFVEEKHFKVGSMYLNRLGGYSK